MLSPNIQINIQINQYQRDLRLGIPYVIGIIWNMELYPSGN